MSTADGQRDGRRADGVHGEVVLRRRDEAGLPMVELLVGGVLLMDDQDASTERLLASEALGRVAGRPGGLSVLVGGLGLGFTAAAVLADPRVTEVVVAEIEPAVVAWVRDDVVPATAGVLHDTRVEVVTGDVRDVVASRPDASWDAVLMDVDNGPGFLVHPGNADLYAEGFLTQTARVLRAGGVLAVWSADPDEDLVAALGRVVGPCEARTVVVTRSGRDLDYTLYLARRLSPRTDRRASELDLDTASSRRMGVVMLTIGGLAGRTGVSTRTLRHWDAVGLLTPFRVDGDTGYRWYVPSQAGRVHAVVALRALGFGLEEVKDLLGGDLTAERLLELLRARESELATQVESASEHLAEVRRRRRSIEEGLDMTTATLQLQPLPALRLVCVSARVTDEAEIGGVVPGLRADLRARCGAAGLGAAPVVCTYHGPPGGGPIEVTVGVAVDVDAGEVPGLEVVELPAEARGAVIHHRGRTGVGDAWVTLDAALEPYGLTTTGVHRQLESAGDDDPLVLQAPVVPLAHG